MQNYKKWTDKTKGFSLYSTFRSEERLNNMQKPDFLWDKHGYFQIKEYFCTLHKYT